MLPNTGSPNDLNLWFDAEDSRNEKETNSMDY